MDTIATLIAALVSKCGQARAAARVLGVTESTLSQARKGHRALGLEPLLLLAHAVGRTPSDVLSAAGKPDLLELITRSFGPSARIIPSASNEDALLLRAFHKATPHDRNVVRMVLGVGAARAKTGLTLARKPRRTRTA